MTTSESHRNHRIGAFGAATASVLMVGFASGANAQIFCPTGANGQLGITLQGGFCTNGNTGALSTAALSSQSLSEVTETTTQQSTTSTLRALEKRRNEAAGSPRSRRSLRQKGRRVRRYRRLRSLQPSGNRPSNGRRGSNRQSDPPRKRQASEQRPTQSTGRETAIYKAPPSIYEPVRYAMWGQGFGDYERRSGPGSAFAPTPIIPLDEGKIRGEGIFAVNFDYGNGLSGFALADVRGGGDVFWSWWESWHSLSMVIVRLFPAFAINGDRAISSGSKNPRLRAGFHSGMAAGAD
jgi:hypothetical protein